MEPVTLKRATPTRLPKLAVTALFFLGLSTNTHLDAATPWAFEAVKLQPPVQAPQTKPTLHTDVETNIEGARVLSTRDELLYRTAFAAQDLGDLKAADEALAQVKDHRLIGHVLAERYLRRDMTLTEAKMWMISFADHPQADAVFTRARRLSGFTAAAIPHPAKSPLWSGYDGHEAPTGFRKADDSDNDLTKTQERVVNKINVQLRRGNAMEARELLSTELQRGTLSVQDTRGLTSNIAASFYYNGQIERARPLAHQAAEAGVKLGLWIDGLASWKQQDYAAAQRAFGKLAQASGLTAWDRSTAAFWAYRAAHHNHDEAASRLWLAEAAKCPRSFYGFMAASLLGKHPDAAWKMPELTAKNVALLSQRAEGWRALALVQVGKNSLADSELRRLSLSGRRDLQVATLALADKARLPSLSLQLGGMATNDNGQIFEAAQYPLPPWQPDGGFKVDRALIYALMKRESQFEPAAVSQSGACGLMQIMPSTARHISNDNKSFANGCPAALLDPATNIALGQKYVRVLAGQPQIGDNLLLLLTAYNGGPGNLARWLDGDERKDPLLFLESLPVRETRDYVQHVMLHYWMYRSRLSQPETSVAQLARGEWPRYASNENEPAKSFKLAAALDTAP